ncbi:MAG: metal ABC transporter permease [Methylophilaceae bacterium]|nr:metal ABC transporter permease [Methylophilaceae bacterium]
MNLDVFDPTIMGPALLAGLLVLATHVPLGREVLRRGIIFIDLAVVQIAGLGTILANFLGWDTRTWLIQAAAFCSALLGALLVRWMEKHWPEVQEALIGAIFILAASASILLLAKTPHGAERLNEVLTGQILWVNTTQLTLAALCTPVILGVWFGLREKLGPTGFYLLFALAVTISVQLVGIYLVFSSLILPALTVRRWPIAWQVAGGYGVGAVAYVLGLVLSSAFDLPSGAVIVWCLAALGVLANLLRFRL